MHLSLFRSGVTRLVLSLVFVGFTVVTEAQNLVMNPSFENVNAGNLQCSWYTTAGQFNNAINNWTCPTGGSTDIFNTALATTCYCSPFSTHASSVGQQAPRTGNGFVNIVTYGNGGCDPWREYVQGTLSTPLVAGQTYEVEMYVSLADNMTVGTNNIGVKFSTTPYTQASNCGYYTAPDLNYTGPIITDKANWTQIIFCYTPTQSGLQHFIIGNFFNDAATATQAAGGGTGNTIRYFVDDVRIEQIVPGGGNPGTDGTTTQCATNPPVDLFTFLGGGPDITGTWTGPSALTGGHLGTFDPATNAPGVYTYTIAGGGACVAGGGGSATVTVTIGSSDATVSPAGPFCFSDPTFFMTGADPGGTWSGPGITNINTGEFDPSVAGTGSHTINYTISGACGDVQSTSVDVNPDLDATITPVGPFCETEPNLNLTAVDAGGTWSGNGITNAANGTFDPATAGPGTHTITYSIPGACGDVQTTTITVNDVFDATISPAGPFCDSDAAVNLTAVDAGGTWSGTGITNATNGTFDPILAGQGTHVITYTIPGSCGDVDTENIVVNIAMDATITPAGPFCDTDAALNLVGADPGGQWSGVGITNAASGTFDPTIAGAGTHTITYNIAGACGDVQTTDITVNLTPDPTVTPAGPFCDSDAAVNLTAVDAGGTWSGTGISNATNGTFDPIQAGQGTHTITYTIPGSCGVSDTEDIVVNPTMDASITAVGPFCDTDAALNLVGVDPGGQWSGVGITNAASGTFDPTIAGAGTHTITYDIAGACGDVQTTDITVNFTPDPTVTPAGPFCDSDAAVNLTAVDAGGAWSGTGISNATNGTFDPIQAGQGTHTITYTIPGSCGVSDTEDIVVNPTMDASITAVGPFCDTDAALNLVGVDPGGQWSGVGITNAASGTFDPTIAGAGTHTITYDIAGACGDVQTTDITVNFTPDPTVTPAGPFCESDPIAVLSALSPGGAWSGNGITNSSTGEFDPVTAGDGAHLITYSIAGNCPVSGTTTITVNALPILPTFVQQSVCNGSILGVQAFNPQPSSATINWLNTTGQDVGFGLNGSGDIGTFTANDPTNNGQIVQVDVTAVSVEGCSSLPESMFIQVNPTPNVMFYGGPVIGCEPLRVTFYNDTQVQGQSCLWDFGDGNTGSSCDSIEHVYMTGLFDVGLTVTTADGCSDNQNINQYIEVSPQPIANFDLSPSVLITEDTEVQFTNTSLNATSYLWSFGDNHSSSDENPVHTYPQVAGTYIATMWAYSNNQLCVDSLQKPITIEDVLIYYVPNTITPDGDSYNEYFKPQFTSGFDFYDFHLTIFNRWGEVIFESYDATKGWNGHYGTGGIVEDGAYVWQIEFKETKSDKRYTERGHVTVLK